MSNKIMNHNWEREESKYLTVNQVDHKKIICEKLLSNMKEKKNEYRCTIFMCL